MHDLLEGIAPKEIKQLNIYYTTNSFFTLKEFNEKLMNFNYGYSGRDNKPVPILSHTLNKLICGSSSQTLLLIRILPFIIVDI